MIGYRQHLGYRAHERWNGSFSQLLQPAPEFLVVWRNHGENLRVATYDPETQALTDLAYPDLFNVLTVGDKLRFYVQGVLALVFDTVTKILSVKAFSSRSRPQGFPRVEFIMAWVNTQPWVIAELTPDGACYCPNFAAGAPDCDFQIDDLGFEINRVTASDFRETENLYSL